MTSLGLDGAKLSDASTPMPAACIAADVPGTAFINLLRNGTWAPQALTEDNVFVDDNLALVDDIAVTGSDFWTFFWVARFNVAASASESASQHVSLELRSIVYRATLWADGGADPVPPFVPPTSRQLKVRTAAAPRANASATAADAVGMFRRFRFPIPAASGSTRGVAVLVKPPDYPGNTSTSCKGCGQGGNHDIAKNAAMSQYTAQWDWIQGTPDRNTGLWDAVSLSLTGQGRLRDPHIVTTPSAEAMAQSRGDPHAATASTAEVAVTVEVDNLDASAPLTAVVMVQVTAVAAVARDGTAVLARDGTAVLHHPNSNPDSDSSSGGGSGRQGVTATLNTTVTVPAGASASVHVGTLTIAKVRLWWPHTHGTPALYQANITLATPAATTGAATAGALAVSDATNVTFGVRTVSSYIDGTMGGRVFRCNGVPLFLEGGNWVTTDQFFRYAASFDRAYKELRMHADMGFNTVRVWGGGIAERPEFFAAADALGLLIYSEFWMSGDNNGRWAGDFSWPLDHGVYEAAAVDTVRTLRNHPSLLFWCAGNELYPTSKNPPPDITQALQAAVADEDGTRLLLLSSMTNCTYYDASVSLAPRDGPYTFLPDATFYDRNPAMITWWEHKLTRADHIPIAFQPEIGSASNPVAESMARFFSPGSLAFVPSMGRPGHYPGVDAAWAYHMWLGFTDARGLDHVYAYCADYQPPAAPAPPAVNDGGGSAGGAGGAPRWGGVQVEGAALPTQPDRADAVPVLRRSADSSTAAEAATGSPTSASTPGAPVIPNATEWAVRATLAQYTQFKALFEGFQEHTFEWYGAVLMWKSQSPWPALRGALYDTYLDQTGGYWGVHAAIEPGSRVHVQLNLNTTTVTLVNKGAADVTEALTVTTQAYDWTGRALYAGAGVAQSVPAGAGPKANSVVRLPEVLPWPSSLGAAGTGDVAFLRLTASTTTTTATTTTTGAADAHTSASEVLSTNDYWRSYWVPTTQAGVEVPPFQDYSGLGRLRDAGPFATLTASDVAVVRCGGVARARGGSHASAAAAAAVLSAMPVGAVGTVVSATVTNTASAAIAFAVRVKLVSAAATAAGPDPDPAAATDAAAAAGAAGTAAAAAAMRAEMRTGAADVTRIRRPSRAGVARNASAPQAVDAALSAAGDARVLPAYYSSNLFSLLPGEARTVAIDFDAVSGGGDGGGGWNVELSAWNVRGGAVVVAPVRGRCE